MSTTDCSSCPACTLRALNKCSNSETPALDAADRLFVRINHIAHQYASIAEARSAEAGAIVSIACVVVKRLGVRMQ